MKKCVDEAVVVGITVVVGVAVVVGGAVVVGRAVVVGSPVVVGWEGVGETVVSDEIRESSNATW